MRKPAQEGQCLLGNKRPGSVRMFRVWDNGWDHALRFLCLFTPVLIVNYGIPPGIVAEISNRSLQWKMYKDQGYGFKVEYLGELIKCDEATVCIRLPLLEEGNVEKMAVVRIFVDKKPFVLLEGTLGGRYYFEEHPRAPILSNRVFTEEVILNGIPFSRDYWVVYGGMGSWDTVINAYTNRNGKYYIISLHYDFISGVPGMEVEGGRKITQEELVNQALKEMLNEKNEYVRVFNRILSTFILADSLSLQGGSQWEEGRVLWGINTLAESGHSGSMAWGYFLSSDLRQIQSKALVSTGKGIWIWKIWLVEDGNLNIILNRLVSTGVNWVIIKFGDSDSYWLDPGDLLYNWAGQYGGFGNVIAQFHRSGIKVFGWHFVYSYDYWNIPNISESDVANRILCIPGIDGLVINAEEAYEGQGKGHIAEQYMQSIRQRHPTSFIAYSSFARVTGHEWFPWLEFGRYSDANMPQAYWAARSLTPEEEVLRMKNDFDYWHFIWQQGGYGDSVKPIVPSGQGGYVGGARDIYPGEIIRFCNIVQGYGYQGIGLYAYHIMNQGAWVEYRSCGLMRNGEKEGDWKWDGDKRSSRDQLRRRLLRALPQW